MPDRYIPLISCVYCGTVRAADKLERLWAKGAPKDV